MIFESFAIIEIAGLFVVWRPTNLENCSWSWQSDRYALSTIVENAC